MVQIIAEQRSLLVEMLPTAVSVMGKTLRSNDERLAASVATTIVKASGILDKPTAMPEPEVDRERRRDAALGQLVRMATNKAARYSIDLADSLIEQLRWIQNYATDVLETYDARGRGALGFTDDRESPCADSGGVHQRERSSAP